jgi:hypothetical protein
VSLWEPPSVDPSTLPLSCPPESPPLPLPLSAVASPWEPPSADPPSVPLSPSLIVGLDAPPQPIQAAPA